MKRIKHQLRSVVILVIMLSIILSSIPVYASELDETTIIKQSVLSFAELFSDKQLAISKMIPIINLEQELIGYSVCLESNEIEYGYVNYEFDKENPITDFSIGEGNVYLDESAEIAHETVLVSMGKGSYELLATSANNSYTAYSSLEAIFSKNYIYSATVLTAPKYTSKYSSAKSLLSEEYITRLTGKYACTVVALTEIAYQEGILYNGSLRSTFDKLWNDTLTSVSYVKNAFSYIRSQSINYLDNNQNKIDVKSFNLLDDVLKNDIICLLLERYNVRKNNDIIKDCLNLLNNPKGNKHISLQNGYIFTLSYDFAEIKVTQIAENYEELLNIDNEVIILNKYRFYFSKKMPENNSKYIKLCYNCLKLPLKVRNKKDGDFIKMSYGNKKISRLMIDEKIPTEQRKTIPLVFDSNDDLLWVVPFAKNQDVINQKSISNIYLVCEEVKND